MNYLIIGNGFVGNYLYKNLSKRVLYPNKLTSCNQIRDLLNRYPDYVLINCAGKIGRPNVDWCDENKENTFDANVRLPMMINEVAKDMDRYWIHISTGCIYQGYSKEWNEEDNPNFYGSFYSRTKIWAEEILNKGCLILRIRMPISEDTNPSSYLNKILNFAKNQVIKNTNQNSITYMEDFKDALIHLSNNKYSGIFNIVNEGSMSIPNILDRYNIKYTLFEGKDEDTMRRRSNCVLSIDKLINTGFKMPSIQDRLDNIKELVGI